MTTWRNRLLELSNGPIGLFALATTGLKSDGEDEIISIGWRKVYPDDHKESGSIYHVVPAELLDKSSAFHGIGMQLLLEHGLEDVLFRKNLQELLSGVNWFTYNTGFQGGFIGKTLGEDGLSVKMFDLPVIVKAIESDMLVSRADSLSELEMSSYKLIGKAAAFKKVLAARNIIAEPPVGVLPFDYSCDCLLALFEYLSGYQAPDWA